MYRSVILAMVFLGCLTCVSGDVKPKYANPALLDKNNLQAVVNEYKCRVAFDDESPTIQESEDKKSRTIRGAYGYNFDQSCTFIRSSLYIHKYDSAVIPHKHAQHLYRQTSYVEPVGTNVLSFTSSGYAPGVAGKPDLLVRIDVCVEEKSTVNGVTQTKYHIHKDIKFAIIE